MKSKSEVAIYQAHFATLMELCHLESSEQQKEFQKYNGRVAVRADIVRDESCIYAAFTE